MVGGMSASATSCIEATVAVLGSLQLDTVPVAWLDQVQDGQYTESVELPPEYEAAIEELDLAAALEELRVRAAAWISLQEEEDRAEERMETTADDTGSFYSKGFWTILTSEHGVRHPVLLALIFHYMDKGQEAGAGARERGLGFKAAALYFTFLGLQGSGAFKIFHPLLFAKALDSFKIVGKLHAGSPKKKGGKASQKKGASQSQSQSMDSTSQGGEEEEQLGPEESRRLVNDLVALLGALHLTLAHCSLKRSQESLESSVTALVSLAGLETSLALDLRTGRQERLGSITCLALQAYRGLALLSRALHGDHRAGVLGVFRGLLPALLMAEKEEQRDLAPRERAVIREHSLNFVLYLVERESEEQADVQRAVALLVQHMAAKVPDKADWRREAAAAIVTLLEALPPAVLQDSLRWLLKFAHSEKSGNRLFSLEVLGRVMHSRKLDVVVEVARDGHTAAEEAREVPPAVEEAMEGVVAEAALPSVSRALLFSCVYGRCSDTSPTVRSAALKALADITAEQSGGVQQLLQQIFASNTGSRRETGRGLAELLQDPTADLARLEQELLPSRQELVMFLRRRALDQSVMVRRSALQVLENILRCSQELMVESLVRVMAEHCRDSSLAVRKQMVVSLTELVRTYPDQESLVATWVGGVFPLILDAEAKASEKVLECIWEIVFGNLVSCGRASTPHHHLPWLVLAAVEKTSMTNYLDRACHTWAKDGRLTPSVVATLQSYIGSEHNGPVWLLLGLISAHIPCRDVSQVLDYFNTSISAPEEVGLYTLLQVLKVLMASVPKMSPGERSSLQELLLGLVRSFQVPTDLISVAMDVITAVSSLETKDLGMKQYQSAVDAWGGPILQEIDKNLSAVFLAPSSDSENEEVLKRQVFTLGVLSMICPHRTHSRFFLIMQSIVFRTSSPPGQQPAAAPLPCSQAVPSSQAPTLSFQPSPGLQALTVVTLGKMCLQNEDQAKKIIPGFGSVLETTSDPAIKSNIMYALADMCVRYASLVDPLLPQMTSCLKDPSTAVRRTTLILLVHLLQEDYLKIRGNAKFFFRLLQTLLDPSEEVRLLSKFYLEQRLLKRIPNIMYSNFPEALFHFTDYDGHGSYNKFAVTRKEKEMFSMAGEARAGDRMQLYAFMLDNMNDEQRFQTTYRLCQDVLGGVVEGGVQAGAASLALLKDTFHCLSSDHIKLQSLKTRAGDDEEPETEQEMAGKVMEAAKKKIISETVKKNVIENIVPIIIALKHKLETEKSPLLREVFLYLRKLMEDYKNEVAEILSADRQMAAEVEFDLRRFDQEEREREEAAAVAAAARSARPERTEARLVMSAPRLVSEAGSTPSREQGKKSAPELGSEAGSTPSREQGKKKRRESLLKKVLSEGVVGINDSFSKMSVGTAGEVMEEAEVINNEEAPASMEEAEDTDQDEVFAAESQAEKSLPAREAGGEEDEMEATGATVATETTGATEATASESAAGESEDTEGVSGVSRVSLVSGVSRLSGASRVSGASDLDNPQPAKVTTAREAAAAQVAVVDHSEPSATAAGQEVEGVVEEVVKEVSKPAVSKEALARKEREIRTAQVCVAKLRVGLNELREELEAAVARQDFTKAQTVKGGIEDMEGRMARAVQEVRELEGGPPSPTVQPEAGARMMAPPQVVEKEGVEPPKRRKSLRGSTVAEEGGSEEAEASIEEEAEKEAGDEDEAVEDVNKSKRVSGQGMERQKENRTPTKSKKFHAQRAVSTPQANKTVLAGGNLTCFGESQLDLSCITVLSPPSSVVSEEAGARRSIRSRSRGRGDDTDATDAVSFRFRKGGKDQFEELLDKGEEAKSRKRKSQEEEEGSRRTSKRKNSELAVISEENNQGD